MSLRRLRKWQTQPTQRHVRATALRSLTFVHHPLSPTFSLPLLALSLPLTPSPISPSSSSPFACPPSPSHPNSLPFIFPPPHLHPHPLPPPHPPAHASILMFAHPSVPVPSSVPTPAPLQLSPHPPPPSQHTLSVSAPPHLSLRILHPFLPFLSSRFPIPPHTSHPPLTTPFPTQTNCTAHATAADPLRNLSVSVSV